MISEVRSADEVGEPTPANHGLIEFHRRLPSLPQFSTPPPRVSSTRIRVYKETHPGPTPSRGKDQKQREHETQSMSRLRLADP